MRDTITQLMEDMLYKAGKLQDARLDKEVAWALQQIAYQAHDGMHTLSSTLTTAKTAAV